MLDDEPFPLSQKTPLTPEPKYLPKELRFTWEYLCFYELEEMLQAISENVKQFSLRTDETMWMYIAIISKILKKNSNI